MANLGGPRANAGRKKGSTNKLSGEKILQAIQKECGKPFEKLLAEGYKASILAMDMPTRQQYEKMFLSKVVADKQEIDVTTLGQSLHNNFVFPTKELIDWKQQPIVYSLDEAKTN